MENKNHTFFGQLEANDNKLNTNRVHQLKISQNKMNHPKNQHKHVKINHTKTNLIKLSNTEGNKTKITELLLEAVSGGQKPKINNASSSENLNPNIHIDNPKLANKKTSTTRANKKLTPSTMRLTIKLGKESLVTREVQTSSPDSIVCIDEKSNDSDINHVEAQFDEEKLDSKSMLKRDKKQNEKTEKNKIDLKSVKIDVSKEKVKKEKKEKLKRSKIDLLRKHAKKQFKMY